MQERMQPDPDAIKNALREPTHNGAMEDQMDVRDTIPQRINDSGEKIEDSAGTGEHDSQGG